MHYKFLKKIIGTIGFKLIDKNLVKNERLLSQYSGLSLTKLLDNLFLNNDLKTIIQIGANDGQRFDILGNFIKKYSPFVIFLEPIESHFNELKKNYSKNKNLIFENLAIFRKFAKIDRKKFIKIPEILNFGHGKRCPTSKKKYIFFDFISFEN